MIVVLGAAGGVLVGELIRRRLVQRRYRYPPEAGLPARATWWLPILTGLTTALLLARGFASWPWPVAVMTVVLGWMLATLSLVDIDVHRLPDSITVPAYPIAVVALCCCSWAVGDWARLGRAALAAPAVIAGYLVLSMLTPGRQGMGLGDVKLAGTTALVLGWFGWGHVAFGNYVAFFSGGVCAVVLLAARRLSRGDTLPFGPFLAFGTVLALLIC